MQLVAVNALELITDLFNITCFAQLSALVFPLYTFVLLFNSLTERAYGDFVIYRVKMAEFIKFSLFFIDRCNILIIRLSETVYLKLTPLATLLLYCF